MKTLASKETPDKILSIPSKPSPKLARKTRKICYASSEQSKAAGDWAVKKYGGVFRRLAE